jgi:hypothetical protein
MKHTVAEISYQKMERDTVFSFTKENVVLVSINSGGFWHIRVVTTNSLNSVLEENNDHKVPCNLMQTG